MRKRQGISILPKRTSWKQHLVISQNKRIGLIKDPGEPRREFGLSGQGGSNGFAPIVVIVI
jgi:hypothetical protein